MQKISLFILLFFCCSLAWTQTKLTDSTANAKTKARNIDFNVMPYLNYNRTLEFMFGAIPMMMYKVGYDLA